MSKNGNGKAEMGLAVLSALSVAGIHSAINPSYFTLVTFSKQPKEKANARRGLWIGLGLGTVASASVWAVFGKVIPAVVAEATAVALFGIGMNAIESSEDAPETPSMAPKEIQTVAPSEAGERIFGLIQPRLTGLRNGVMVVR